MHPTSTTRFSIFHFRFFIFHFCWTIGLSVSVAAQPLDTAAVRCWLWMAHPDSVPFGSLCGATNLEAALQKQFADWEAEGFLTAAVDSIGCDMSDTVCCVYFQKGKTYRWVGLRSGNVPSAALQQAGFQAKRFKGRPVSLADIQSLQSRLLTLAENNGYPFARVWLGEIEASEAAIQAAIFWEHDRLVRFKGIEVVGDANISRFFLENYLGIKPETPYSEERVRKISSRLRELPFLQEKQSPSIVFAQDGAWTTLFLQKKKASKFDFLLGFLPKGDQTSRLTLSGSLQAVLQNPFGKGETLAVDWQQLRPETAQLEVALKLPYILRQPFGVDGRLHLFRQDTTFRTVQLELGVQYTLQGNNFFKAYWQQSNTALLGVATAEIIRTKRLPATLDVGTSLLGLAGSFEQVDYRQNPSKGFQFAVNAAAGYKHLEPNPSITSLHDPAAPTFDFGQLYSRRPLRTVQYRASAQAAGYVPLWNRRNVVKIGLQAAAIIGTDTLNANERYRIGGSRVLRGFDEGSILAARYGVLTGEYRFIMGQHTFLYGFVDAGATLDNSIGNRITDAPFGLGLGMNVETAAGIVTISAAVGSQQQNPLNLRAAKVHFGYVNYF